MQMNINTMIPGTVEIPGRRTKYIQLRDARGLDIYRALAEWTRTNNRSDNCPGSGGVVFDECEIECPDGLRFTAFSYRGDLEGWERLIAAFATERSLLTAVIVDATFKLNTGQEWNLHECRIHR